MANWPTVEMYESAMRDWRHTLSDPDLRAGKLQAFPNGDPQPIHGSGLYICAYKVGDWLVRCFRYNEEAAQNPPADIRERYEKIGLFYQHNVGRAEMLVPVYYQPNGITVAKQSYPIVKMRFLTQAPPLGVYIRDHHAESYTMRRLAETWMQLITAMEEAPLAHGDLDLTNVLVQGNPTGPLVLKLIDYDNMWIPDLSGHPQVEGGHAPFQHPDIRPRPFDVTMDRFSALVIYISLLAISLNGSLYGEFKADESEKLLFDKDDYRNVGFDDNRVRVLRKRVGNAQLNPYLDALEASLRTKTMPPRLDTIPRAPSMALPQAPVAPPPRPPQPPRMVNPQGKGAADKGAPIYNQPGAQAPSYQPVLPGNRGLTPGMPPSPSGYAPTPPPKSPNTVNWGLIALIIIVVIIIIAVIASGSHSSGMVIWPTGLLRFFTIVPPLVPAS